MHLAYWGNEFLSSVSSYAEGDQPDCELNDGKDDDYYTFECLKSIDPLAANRIHPNDHRKVS